MVALTLPSAHLCFDTDREPIALDWQSWRWSYTYFVQAAGGGCLVEFLTNESGTAVAGSLLCFLLFASRIPEFCKRTIIFSSAWLGPSVGVTLRLS